MTDQLKEPVMGQATELVKERKRGQELGAVMEPAKVALKAPVRATAKEPEMGTVWGRRLELASAVRWEHW